MKFTNLLYDGAIWTKHAQKEAKFQIVKSTNLAQEELPAFEDWVRGLGWGQASRGYAALDGTHISLNKTSPTMENNFRQTLALLSVVNRPQILW